MKIRDIDGDEFFATLDTTETPCIVRYENRTGEGSGVVIISAGAKFVYSDDENKVIGKSVNLGPGKGTVIASPFPKKCVVTVAAGIQFKFDDKVYKRAREYDRLEDEDCIDEIIFALIVEDGAISVVND